FTGDPLIDDMPADVEQAAVVDAGRAGGLARAAGEAAVEVELGLDGRLCALEHLLDEIDPPARAVELVPEDLVGGAGGRAEAAVDALAQDRVGVAALGGVFGEA